ncbi:MAG: hypothetical protein IJB03_04845 [Alistipes sp.]|nr:hypothetical protein [Alistipes sp.]
MKTNNFFKFLLMAVLTLGVAVGCQEDATDDGKKPNEEQPGDEQPGDEQPGENKKPEIDVPFVMEDFTVTLTALHSGDVWFNIEPKDKEMTYFFGLAIKEAMPETDEELFTTDLDYFNYLANNAGTTLEAFLTEALIKGDKEHYYYGLNSRNDYVLYMYGIDAKGQALTAVNQLTFTTTQVQPLDCSFELVEGTNTTATSFSVTIIPSDDTVGYYYDVFESAWYEEYCMSDAANLPEFIATYIPEVALENEVDVPTAVGYMSNFGSVVADFTSEDGIQPSTTYYVFAIGIGADGTATTEAKVIAITTARPPMNTFEVKEATIEDDRASFYVVPSQNETYVALFELEEYMYNEDGTALTDEEIIDAILVAQGNNIGNHIYSGTKSITECPMIPNKDYYCLVFGYFGGEVTTPLTKVAFKTTEADASECEFLLMIGTPTTTTCGVSFDPSIVPTPHMFNYMPYTTFEEYGANADAIKKYNDELVDRLYNEWLDSHSYAMSKEEWLSRALETDYNSWVIDGLTPNTKYLVYVIGMVPDGSYTTAPEYKDFTTKEVKEGPHIKEILFNINKKNGHIGAWVYLDMDTEVKWFKMSHIVNDDTIYNLSDEELLVYLEEDHETTFKNEITNQTYFTINDSNLKEGDTVYYAGAAYDADGNARVYRETCTL